MNAGTIFSILKQIVRSPIAKAIGHEVFKTVSDDALRLCGEAETSGKSGDEKYQFVFNELKAKYATKSGVKDWLLDTAIQLAVAGLQKAS